MTIKQNGGVFGRNPTFNDVTIEGQLTFDGDIDINSDLKIDGDLDVGAGLLYVDSTNRKVGFDTTSPQRNYVFNGGGSTCQVQITNDTTGLTTTDGFQLKQYTSGAVQVWNYEDSYLAFATNNTECGRFLSTGGLDLSAGNLIVDSGYGIDFSATAGTGTSELLDDYEEGVWTPTQGTFTTWTSPTFAATYTKVGRLVTLNIAQTGGVIAASSAALYIGGSPYSAAYDAVGVVSDGSINDHGHCVISGTNIFFSNIIAPEINFIVTITFHVA